MIKSILTLILVIFVVVIAKSQTIVAGQISTTTNWSITGSPYIIVDTVELLPGNDLIIDAGVEVRFSDSAQLLISSGAPPSSHIITNGTINDSIRFTSNSSTPFAGVYSGIRIEGEHDSQSNFKYCKFQFAEIAIKHNGFVLNILKISNSTFADNNIAVKQQMPRQLQIDSCIFTNNTYALFDALNSTITNCVINQNQYGSYMQPGWNCPGCGTSFESCTVDSNNTAFMGLYPYANIDKCFIRYNVNGIVSKNLYQGSGNNVFWITNNLLENNTTGIIVSTGGMVIDSNEIRNNIVGIIDSGGIKLNKIIHNEIEANSIGMKIATSNDLVCSNMFCNNSSYSLVNLGSFNIDVSYNSWCTVDSVSTSNVIYDVNDSMGLGTVVFMPIDSLQECDLTVSTKSLEKADIKVYPIPAKNSITITSPEIETWTTIKVYDILGVLQPLKTLEFNTLDISVLDDGIYILEILAENNSYKIKFIKK